MGRKSSINKLKRNNSESKDIQAAIMMDLYLKGYSPITANFTADGLSECDVLAVSKANLMYEFEIKISKSDFKKDFCKVYKHRMLAERVGTKQYTKWVKGYKTDEMETSFITPNYFTYLVPKDLVSLEEIPEYAGLMYIMPDYKTFEWVKKPPKLHDARMNEKLLRTITHNLMCKFIFGSSYQMYLAKNNELGKGVTFVKWADDNEMPDTELSDNI